MRKGNKEALVQQGRPLVLRTPEALMHAFGRVKDSLEEFCLRAGLESLEELRRAMYARCAVSGTPELRRVAAIARWGVPQATAAYRGRLLRVERPRVVADHFGAPTCARLAAEVTALALQQDLTRRKDNRFESGAFHLTAAGETSWHGFASAIVEAARARVATLKCRAIAPITTAEYPLPAAQPANSGGTSAPTAVNRESLIVN